MKLSGDLSSQRVAWNLRIIFICELSGDLSSQRVAWNLRIVYIYEVKW